LLYSGSGMREGLSSSGGLLWGYSGELAKSALIWRFDGTYKMTHSHDCSQGWLLAGCSAGLPECLHMTSLVMCLNQPIRCFPWHLAFLSACMPRVQSRNCMAFSDLASELCCIISTAHCCYKGVTKICLD
jgi:hypothetical protein